MKTRCGFSLVELLVALIIVGIITTIAVVLYLGQARNGRRVDAINAIYSISLAEENYRSSNTQYGTLAQVWNSVSASTAGYYTLAISNIAATSYTITATAVGDQANDVESAVACSTLTFAMSSGTITKTPTACWPS